jgi:hypothetical protein
MGVLDDAIRQHIELKRQHGASEQELERKQEEALGPARREAAAEVGGVDEGAPSEVPDEVDGPASESDETPFSEQETRIVSTDPAPVADEAAAPVDDWLEPEPDVTDADDAAADDPADEPEDVLEETPEFLQETPEHDRLWFEQKPPRDFDFDDK